MSSACLRLRLAVGLPRRLTLSAFSKLLVTRHQREQQGVFSVYTGRVKLANEQPGVLSGCTAGHGRIFHSL